MIHCGLLNYVEIGYCFKISLTLVLRCLNERLSILCVNNYNFKL